MDRFLEVFRVLIKKKRTDWALTRCGGIGEMGVRTSVWVPGCVVLLSTELRVQEKSEAWRTT